MRRSVKYGLYGAVLAAVVGGTAAFATAANAKTVTLVVNGQTNQIHTSAGTVNGALSAAGYHVGSHDLVAPAIQSKISNGSRIVFDQGRLLKLDVDGTHRDVWTTAPTVAVAMAQLGYSSADFVSVSRSQRLPLGVLDLQVRTPKSVTLVDAGKAQAVTTTDATVAQLLSAEGVVLDSNDRVEPALSTPLASRQRIVVQRVIEKRLSKHESIAYGVKQTNDASMYRGQTTVLTAGRSGSQTLVYDDVYINGKLSAHTLVTREVTSQPRTEVEKVGTKSRPTPPVSSSGGGLNWTGVANCESGGDWSINTGNGFYGGVQFDYGTWLAYGGGAYAKTANLASESQQIAIATKLYDARGSSPWPVCGRYL